MIAQALAVAAIILLVFSTGVMRATEIATVLSRKKILRHLAKKGDKRAGQALDLIAKQAHFSAAVELSVVFVAIVVSALGGALAACQSISMFPLYAPLGSIIGGGIVIIAVSCIFIVLAELLPRRLALRHAETIARFCAPAMLAYCRLASPLVAQLSPPGDGKRKSSRLRQSGIPATTQELEGLVESGPQAGLQQSEADMLSGILKLDSTRISAMMTPRTELVWLDERETPEQIIETIKEKKHTRYIVASGDLENPVGVVNARDLLMQWVTDNTVDLQACRFSPLIVPENKTALDVLELFKSSKLHIAFVMDEYGSLRGLVTMSDILEALIGDQSEIGDTERYKVIELDDGSKLFDAVTPLLHFKRALAISELPGEDEGAYSTLGGFVLYFLEHVPAESESFDCQGLNYKVTAMDGHRIDKVVISQRPEPDA